MGALGCIDGRPATPPGATPPELFVAGCRASGRCMVPAEERHGGNEPVSGLMPVPVAGSGGGGGGNSGFVCAGAALAMKLRRGGRGATGCDRSVAALSTTASANGNPGAGRAKATRRSDIRLSSSWDSFATKSHVRSTAALPAPTAWSSSSSSITTTSCCCAGLDAGASSDADGASAAEAEASTPGCSPWARPRLPVAFRRTPEPKCPARAAAAAEAGAALAEGGCSSAPWSSTPSSCQVAVSSSVSPSTTSTKPLSISSSVACRAWARIRIPRASSWVAAFSA
mmetsp:Transcript_2721/g.10614  ORF Transcript_2721/g.10614 Transcript_2721/m.10614 type:complete len:284 (-) Transcript_2721:239-1090(-)